MSLAFKPQTRNPKPFLFLLFFVSFFNGGGGAGVGLLRV